MNIIKPLLASAIIATNTFGANAVIAIRDVMTVTQPDGTTLRIKKTGDEAMHFTITEDGILLYESNGLFTYGRITDTGLVESTGVKAVNLEQRTGTDAAEATHLADIDMAKVSEIRGVSKRRAQSYQAYNVHESSPSSTGIMRVPQTGVGLTSSTFPSKGSTKGLIVLVAYQDVDFTHPDPAQYFNDMINKKGFNEYGGTGSALDYFTEQSGGLFTPDFDVYGPVILSGNRATYGGNNSNGDDRNPAGMVVQACQQLDYSVDFSQYDTDGDGLIDNVFVIYAGQGEASYGPAESVWPHSWDVRYGGYNITLDGVKLAHYACTNEWKQNRPDGVGTFIHEFSHVMGLPDLYDTNGQGLTCTPGAYSVLDYGPYNNDGCTPPNYGAYEKNALGWCQPIILDSPETLTLDPISTGKFGMVTTASTNEFFLFENRQQTGWDKFIPGHGMLIWHIDYNENVFTYNTVNNTRSHQYCDIEEANNTPNNANRTAMAGWPFPGTSNKTEFTASTTPAMQTWSGTSIDVPITNIEESSDGVITFDVMGGGTRIETPVATADIPSVSDRHFIARWNHVEGATDYIINVYALSDDEEGEVNIGFDGSVLPQGWLNSQPTDSWYTTGSYGTSSPAFRMDTDGQTLTSPVYPGNITEISFYIYGVGANMTSSLYVMINENDSFSRGYQYQMSGNQYKGTATINTENGLPEGIHQIQFRLAKGRGNAAIDDINIKYGTPDLLLPDYAGISTGGENSLRVDKLLDGRTQYYFTVTAMGGNQRSRTSEPCYVTVAGMSGVEDFTMDADPKTKDVYFNLQGVRISKPMQGNMYIRVRGNRAEKVIF